MPVPEQTVFLTNYSRWLSDLFSRHTICVVRWYVYAVVLVRETHRLLPHIFYMTQVNMSFGPPTRRIRGSAPAADATSQFTH
jgi:hypothetical protein